jgi:hypothetical protein
MYSKDQLRELALQCEELENSIHETARLRKEMEEMENFKKLAVPTTPKQYGMSLKKRNRKK